ncbi:MAG: hypothetical protein H0T59_05640 [Chloroflexi bacterium]|nr:hypothetical protein [Chloroflexota bacterium]
MATRFDVLHVGSACRDVDPTDPRGWRLGGGVTYSALTTARLGLRTAAVIGVDPEARAAHEFGALQAAGVEMLFVPLSEGPIYRNVDSPSGRVQTCIQVGVPLPVPILPDDLATAPAWSMVPVAGELGDAWAGAIPEDAYVAVAWQGMLRQLAAGRVVTPSPPVATPLLDRAQLVGVSHHDLDGRTPIDSLLRLLGRDARLLITRGGEGGLLVTARSNASPTTVRYEPARAQGEVDPTGAGDTFLAALLATVVRPDLLGRDRAGPSLDLPFAAAAGSLVVEGSGLAGVPDLSGVVGRLETGGAVERTHASDETHVGVNRRD